MKEKDDSKWENYTEEYLHQIIQVYRDKENDFFITPGGVEYVGDDIEFKDKLHSNFQKLYKIAYRLKPKSILECGCGGCYHLKNLNALLPDAEIHGFDITQKQVSFGRWFSQLPKKIDENLFVMNLVTSVTPRQYEFVYTHAVIMHMGTANALSAMNNMKKMSSKYIFMMENPGHHGGVEAWHGMIKDVFGDCDIEWPASEFDPALIIKR